MQVRSGTRYFSLTTSNWYLLTFVCVIVIPAVILLATWPAADTWYAKIFVLPPLEKDLGFELHAATVRVGECVYEQFEIGRVTSGGEFERAGIRPGDLPFAYHHGIGEFIWQLQNSRGRTAVVHVIGRAQLEAGKPAHGRAVSVHVPVAAPN